jgi:hypothetical protein
VLEKEIGNMGREAYRMGVRFVNPEISKEKVIEELLDLGAIDTKRGKFEKVYLEFAFEEGFVEILVYNQREYAKLLDESLYLDNTENLQSYLEKPNHTVMEMRFAKVNSIKLVDKIIDLMRILKENKLIKEVGDLEVRETIDLTDYSKFKEHVKHSKSEFESWHHTIQYPIRCSEVYETYHRLYPEEYKTGNTINGMQK